MIDNSEYENIHSLPVGIKYFTTYVILINRQGDWFDYLESYDKDVILESWEGLKSYHQNFRLVTRYCWQSEEEGIV